MYVISFQLGAAAWPSAPVSCWTVLCHVSVSRCKRLQREMLQLLFADLLPFNPSPGKYFPLYHYWQSTQRGSEAEEQAVGVSRPPPPPGDIGHFAAGTLSTLPSVCHLTSLCPSFTSFPCEFHLLIHLCFSFCPFFSVCCQTHRWATAHLSPQALRLNTTVCSLATNYPDNMMPLMKPLPLLYKWYKSGY